MHEARRSLSFCAWLTSKFTQGICASKSFISELQKPLPSPRGLGYLPRNNAHAIGAHLHQRCSDSKLGHSKMLRLCCHHHPTHKLTDYLTVIALRWRNFPPKPAIRGTPWQYLDQNQVPRYSLLLKPPQAIHLVCSCSCITASENLLPVSWVHPRDYPTPLLQD